MLDPLLATLLVCPACHGELEERGGALFCPVCGETYPVEGQIPIMLKGSSNDGFGHDLYHAQWHGNFFEQVFHHNRVRTILRLVEELEVPAGARVIDVGCNTGPVLIPLRERGYAVVGVDISPGDVHRAEGYLREHGLPAGGLAVADGGRLPFRDREFDLILLIDVLEHTEYPRQMVLEARRLLKPGGLIIATVPWAYHPFVRYTWIRKALSSRKTIDEHPDAPFTLRMLKELFPDFVPLMFRLVFHWVCLLGVFQVPVSESC